LRAKSAALNAQEVKRLELKKSNDRLQEKISEIKALSEQMRINKVNFDNQKNTLTKLSDSLRTQISKLKNENTKYIESLDRSQMETEMANKKNDTLLKEVSELNDSLRDSQKNMKSLQLDSDKKVREMENMITKFQESLKKELNEKADIKANLKTSESQLKESQIKNQELRKRITELEEAESSDQ
jgi:DNA-binding beta-propeller fold protein YncE